MPVDVEESIVATVQDVSDRNLGSQLVNAVTAGATTIQVVNPYQFNLDSGQLQIGSDIYSFTMPEYDALVAPQNDSSVPSPVAGEEEPIDDEFSYSGTLNISPAAVNSYGADTEVYVYPLVTERWAIVNEPGAGESMDVRVDASMYPQIGLGARGQGQGEVVMLHHNGTDLVLKDMYGAAPAVDGGFIQAGTIKAGHINVAVLSAITANLGNITAGTMTAVTTQTSSSDPRGIFDGSGFRLTEADGTTAFSVAGGNGITFLADAGEGLSVSREVRWMQSGTKIVEATGWESGGFDVALLQATRRSTNTARAVLSAGDGGAHTASQLRVSQAGTTGDVTAQAGSSSVTIIDESGNSRFAKLILASDHTIHRGTATCTFPGANETSNVTVVTHSLGSTPVAVVATPQAGTALYAVGVSSLGSTTFGLTVRTINASQPANGTNVTVYWYAFT